MKRMVALTMHESSTLMRAINDVRSGTAVGGTSVLTELARWEPVRLFTSLAIVAERYLHLLDRGGVIALTGEHDDTQRIVNLMLRSLPTGSRGTETSVLNSLFATSSKQDNRTWERLAAEPEAVVVEMLQLAAAAANLAMEIPAQQRPSLPETLQGIAAPLD
jgi:hypothetical protein